MDSIRHLILYAKGHYRKSGDTIEDLKHIAGHVYGIDVKYVETDSVLHMCVYALPFTDEYKRKPAPEDFFADMLKDMGKFMRYDKLFSEHKTYPAEFSENAIVRVVVDVILSWLSGTLVIHHDGTLALDLGSPDPSILPLNENLYREAQQEKVQS